MSINTEFFEAVQKNNIGWIEKQINLGTITWDEVLLRSVAQGRSKLFDQAVQFVNDDQTIKLILRKAVERNNGYVIEKLIGPPYPENNEKWRLIDYVSLVAVEMNNMAMLKFMTWKYSFGNKTSTVVNLDDGLKVAVLNEYTEMIEHLILSGADKKVGFETAVYCNSKELVDYFYDSIQANNINGTNLGVEVAIKENNIEMLEYLISKDVSNNTKVAMMGHVLDNWDIHKHFAIKFYMENMNK